jgi:glutathione S-transferase
MKIFEKTGVDHSLKSDHGFLLGSTISVADNATTFWNMINSFPELKNEFNKYAPHVSALCVRIEARPNISPFLKTQREKYGNTYCGGKIERSLRDMLKSRQLVGIVMDSNHNLGAGIG